MLRTRFAPSPTGHLHVGNAYSALVCQQWAERHHAGLLLRVEDIDHTRCRQGFIDDMIEDLRWLGVCWQGEPMFQSQRLKAYQDALDLLRDKGVLYPCFCTRRQIQDEIGRMAGAPHVDEGVDRYPGTCRQLPRDDLVRHGADRAFAWRLDIARSFDLAGGRLGWEDGRGRRHLVHPQAHGDVVLGRKDVGFSYHLAVVVDDASQGVSHVIRGRDLAASTGIHRLLQALLELPSPVYIHHELLLDGDGRRMAKRHGAPSLRELRQRGVSPGALREALLHNTDMVWRPEKVLAGAA